MRVYISVDVWRQSSSCAKQPAGACTTASKAGNRRQAVHVCVCGGRGALISLFVLPAAPAPAIVMHLAQHKHHTIPRACCGGVACV